MKYAALERHHALYDSATMERYELLFEGGAAIRKRMSEFIPRHDVEMHDTYKRRLKSAFYINYAAPLVNTMSAWLFAGPHGIRATGDESSDLPEWAGALRDHASGQQDLSAFLGERVVDALVHQRAFWRVEASEPPPGLSLDEWSAGSFDELQLCAVSPRSVTHWHRDDEGRFHWLVEREEYVSLESFESEERRVIEWTLWSATAPPRRWRLVADPARPVTPQTDVPEINDGLPARPGVPFVCLELPTALWLMNAIADPLVEITRKRNAQSYAIDRTCYTMPVLYSASKKPIGAMGAGYFLQLGKDDRIEYLSPPSTPFDVIESHIAGLKDELYRVVQQMAAGVDNNAAAIGRSAESKSADAQSTVIILRALGAIVRNALARTFDLGAEILGTGEDFAAFGFDQFSLESVSGLVETIVGVDTAGAASPTMRFELHKQLAQRVLPHAPANVLSQIFEELEPEEPSDDDGTVTAVAGVPAGDAPVADTAFNGAQIGSLVDVVKGAALGEIPRESALAIITLAFPSIDATEADLVLGSIGRGFQPSAPASSTPTQSTPSALDEARQAPSTTGGA